MGPLRSTGSDAEDGAVAIKRAHELHVTFFDTPKMYGWGENEKIVGQAGKLPRRGAPRHSGRLDPA